MENNIRSATPDDSAALLAIYAPYVRDTAISFEIDVPSPDEFRRRMDAVMARYPWLVYEEEGRVVGYAYAHRYAERAAYAHTVETSIYLDRARHRRGVGRALYEHLFAVLREGGFRVALAGVTTSNPVSEGFHRALGFTPVGVFHRIGFKLGQWRDVLWLERSLGNDFADSPPPPGVITHR